MDIKIEIDKIKLRPEPGPEPGPEPWPYIILYLCIVPEGLEERHITLARVPPTEKFFETVREEVRLHLVEGKVPPAEIIAAIMNISDDLKSGRDPVIRAGDYITLMDYFRTKKIS